MTKQTDYSVLKNKVDEIYPQVVSDRRHIHQNPELSEHETKTSQYIMDRLSELNIPCKKISGNGVLGLITGNGQKDCTFAVRGDIDALPIQEKTGLPFASQNPGVMHACGHDMHTSILLGTARVLSSMREELPGNVKLFFQPAEETIGGAAQMIEAGCMENPKVDAVLGLHVTECQPVGTIEMCRRTMNAATSEIHIRIIGKSCHGAHPEGGVDAIVIAANIISALQTIITRNLAPTDPLIITIGTIHGGAKENVVAGEVVLGGTLRSLTIEHRTFAQNRIRELCEGIAKSYGGSCEVSFGDGYPPLINDDRLVDLMDAVGSDLLGRDNVRYLPAPSLGADDFAFFCQAVPSLYYNLGTADPSKGTPAPLHNEGFSPEEEAMKTGILTQVAAVLRLMDEWE